MPDDALRAALAKVAVEDLEDVLEEAREGARARAREMIEDILVEQLLEAAARSPAEEEPAAPPPDGHVLWAYCVLSAADAPALPDIRGIERGSVVECIVEGDLAVLVSEVPIADYDDERLREHLNDIDWVERTARAHEDVLEQALAVCTIVPLRLCTLFHDRDGVRRLLRDDRASLNAGLRTLAGRAEWGLKLFVNSRRLQESLAATAADDAESAGLSYINRKQRERETRAAADEAISEYAATAHERLAAVADAARVNPTQRPEAHGHEGEMVLNGAYLVKREREPQLMRVVEELRSEWEGAGLDLELTGPWPGYNFVAGTEPVTP
jgi:gas vesicle protein GvpL/GvpF